MNLRWISVVIILLVVGSCSIGGAAESRYPVITSGKFEGLFGDTMTYSEKVVATSGRTKLYADRVVYDKKSNVAIATGNALLIKEDVFISSDTITYNFNTEKGMAPFGVSHSKPWYVWGQKIYKQAENQYKIVNGYLTTSDYLEPQWRIQTTDAVIYVGDKIVARNAVLYLGRVPVMWFPKYVYSLKEEYTPLNIILGRNGDWGGFVLASYSWFFNRIKPTLHLDYRQNNKFAGGVDVAYSTPQEGRGLLKTYYADDRHRELSDGTVVDDERYRVSLRHDQPLGAGTYGMLEFHKLSDIDMIDDFFRDESDLEVQPESYLNITNYTPNYTINFFARAKVNDFYNVLEKTPELSFDIRNQRLGNTSFYYSGQNSVGRLEQDFAEDSSDTDYDSLRLDTLHKFSYPDKYFGWLNIVPRLSLRGTYFGTGVTEDNLIRGVLSPEIEFFTKIFRIWDIENPASDIHGLRHIVEPRLIYSYTPTPNYEPEELLQFDRIDRIDYRNRFKIDLRNKFQTKRYGGVWDLVDLDAFTYFYPDENDEGRSLSDVFFDLELRPSRHFLIDADLEWDTYDGEIDVFNTQLTYYDKDLWSINVEHRFLNDESNLLASGFFCQINPEWALRLYSRYEFEESNVEETQISLIHDLNTWESSLTFRRREDENQFWLMFYLKQYPIVPIIAGN